VTLRRILSGGSFTQHQLDDADLRQGTVAVLQLLALVASAVFFLRWFHRSYKNLRAVGGEQRYGQGWAIGAWFIPILNLFRPKQIANDIWRGSDPANPVATLLGWWWAAFLVSQFADNIAGRLAFHGNTVSDIRSADLASCRRILGPDRSVSPSWSCAALRVDGSRRGRLLVAGLQVLLRQFEDRRGWFRVDARFKACRSQCGSPTSSSRAGA
jgi:hypothetical protein